MGLNILGKVLGLQDMVLGVIDRFKLSPEKKAEMKMAIMANQAEMAKFEAEVEQTLMKAASANIVAEATSKSWMARNARPFFVFGMGATLMFNVVAPIISRIAGSPFDPVPVPSELVALYGFGFLGYTGARSWEKIVGANKLTKMVTGS